jgi:porphobilinogen synthase
MSFPVERPRRLRAIEGLRRLVRETRLAAADLVMPYFVVHGDGVKSEIPSMPGNHHLSADRLVDEVARSAGLGVPAVLLFGIPRAKDPAGSEAWADDGAVQQALRRVKARLPGVVAIADVCLCEYTDHGHCGVLSGNEPGTRAQRAPIRHGSSRSAAGGRTAGPAGGLRPPSGPETAPVRVANDPTLPLLARTAVSLARAGADVIAPSDMMDGRVRAIRGALDDAGFAEVPIMSYAAKYASAFYGPFRSAAGSAPGHGDRRGYQMDPPNVREALREVALDIDEGADIVMVKPALAYLDVVRAVRERFDVPLAAYNVSGEYSMVKAAAARGWIDEKRAVLEIATGIKRAGADILITYHANEIAGWLQSAPETSP